MAKLVIDNDLLVASFFENTCLMGIVAPLSDFHFCNVLKQQLGFQFRNDLASEIAFKKRKRDYYFSVFKFEEPSSAVVHYLYCNKCDGELLLPEFKHLDFLWLVQFDSSVYPITTLLQAVKSIAGVQLIVELTNEKIINKEHLIL
jgi:myosin-crossreactive antigen